MSWLDATASGVRLHCHIQPRAARTEIRGEHGGALKIRLAAPPVDGAANETLVRFLATRLGIPASRVTLVRGAGGRKKVLDVAGVTLEQAMARLGTA